MLRQPCLQYLHYVGVYEDPLGTKVSKIYAPLLGASSDLVDQCQIDTALGLRRVAEDRGVPLRVVKREFRAALRALPTARQLARFSAEKAARRLTAAHTKLQLEGLDADQVAAAELPAVLSERSTWFGAQSTGWLFRR